MTLFNELQKVRALTSGGGGSLVPSVQNRAITDRRLITAASSSAISNFNSGRPVGSNLYSRTVNHGGGQFSATSRYYNNNANQAQVFCQAFTVNQTTGAITVGSGATLLSTSGFIDTGTYAWAGNYVVTQHTSNGVGNSQSVAVVSGNSVTGFSTGSNNTDNQPVHDGDMSYYRSGNTMYWYPSVYNQNDGLARLYGWVFNGSSISVASGTNPSSNTSTTYTWPVVPQFGQTSPTSGYAGIRTYRTTNSYFMDILNSTGGTSNQINMNSNFSFLSTQNQNPQQGWGLELSDGQQLFYSRGIVYRSSGNSLSILNGADLTPKNTVNRISDIWPTGTNTWVCLLGSNFQQPAEMVQFSVNPSNYNVTIVKSVPLTPYLPVAAASGTLNAGTHISFTGTTNQYVVVSVPTTMTQHLVTVFPTPF